MAPAATSNLEFLADCEILQVNHAAADVGIKAIDFAGQMARQMGAAVYTGDAFAHEDSFLGRGKTSSEIDDPVAWCLAAERRLLLVAGDNLNLSDYDGTSAVLLQVDADASEATLFAESGIADLLGDPERPPIIPTGDFGAGTAAYGVLAALCAIATKTKRCGARDVAEVDAAGVLAWVNWKGGLTGAAGRDISRQGEKAEWPVVPCKDGHVALVYQERDWRPLIEMIGDTRLAEERFATSKSRTQHTDEYMAMIRQWSITKSKRELVQLFLDYEIPAAPVMTEADLLEDPLLQHRQAFVEIGDGRRSPRLAHRVIAAEEVEETASQPGSALPLAGIRVLDLGIITAGAGVGALLGDLGAEVLKIESETYPDPFRAWAGDAVSPFFKGNNRNKYGLALDLKTDEGRAAFTALVKTADVVLENFRRGVLDRLGFDYATLKAINPRIVLASISGQGLSGPGAEATSFGSTLEASSGFSVNACYEDGVPYITGRNLNYPDQTVVLYSAAVLTAALADRRVGMQIDISQRDVAIFLSGQTIESVSAGAEVARQSNGRAFEAEDGSWFASAVDELEQKHWATAGEAVTMLQDQGVSAAVIQQGSGMYERFRQGYQFLHSPCGDLVKGFPFQLCNTPLQIRLDSPAVGEHTGQFVLDPL